MTTTAAEKKPRWKPWTRVEQPGVVAKGVKLPSGYTPAYFRKRASLAVLRANDCSHYLIFNTSTGASMVATTCKIASETMSQIRKGELKLEAA